MPTKLQLVYACTPNSESAWWCSTPVPPKTHLAYLDSAIRSRLTAVFELTENLNFHQRKDDLVIIFNLPNWCWKCGLRYDGFPSLVNYDSAYRYLYWFTAMKLKIASANQHGLWLYATHQLIASTQAVQRDCVILVPVLSWLAYCQTLFFFGNP